MTETKHVDVFTVPHLRVPHFQLFTGNLMQKFSLEIAWRQVRAIVLPELHGVSMQSTDGT
jgi:hypothetical protein